MIVLLILGIPLLVVVIYEIYNIVRSEIYDCDVSKSSYYEQMGKNFTYTIYSYGMLWDRSTENKIGDMPRIEFDKFQKFYILNPDSWSLCDDSVYKNNDPDLSFTFDYKDWVKYKMFCKQEKEEKILAELRKKQEELDKKNNEKTVKLLKLVQEDIDAARNAMQQDFKEAAELIDRIAKG